MLAFLVGKLDEAYSLALVSMQQARHVFQRPVDLNTTTTRRGSAKRRRSLNDIVSAESQLPFSCSPLARIEIGQSADLELLSHLDQPIREYDDGEYSRP